MHPDWARSIRDQCVAARVPFFFKQWGEFGWQQRYLDGTPGLGPVFAPIRVGKKDAGRLLDGQQWSQMP
jgi:protein gp37